MNYHVETQGSRKQFFLEEQKPQNCPKGVARSHFLKFYNLALIVLLVEEQLLRLAFASYGPETSWNVRPVDHLIPQSFHRPYTVEVPVHWGR